MDSAWVKRNLDGAQYAESRGSQYEGPYEDWDEPDADAPCIDGCVTYNAKPEFAQVTRRDVRDFAIILVTVFVLVVGLCLLLSRTAWVA